LLSIGLAPEDGMWVFRQWTPLRTNEVDDDSAMNVSRLTGNHPLSLRLLGGMFDILEDRHSSVDTCIQYSFDCLDDTLKSLLERVRLFEIPFTATTTMKAMNHAIPLSHELCADNLYKLWQQGWLNELYYDSTIADWRPRFMRILYITSSATRLSQSSVW